ncbi:hypothetical protein I3760_15G097500 [Carya illinoinensis]|nr:hypothetical protein I3760_15G097500 [Carya illinoinensis]
MEFGIFGWWLLLAALFQLSSIHGCLREERVALFQLNTSLNSSYGYCMNNLNIERNCCDWACVVCDNTTGRVIELHLTNGRISYIDEVWYLNASLFLPFQELKYLDLSNNKISGWVPNEGFERLSGLSKLEVLDLSYNYINESFLSSLGQILSLKKLYLSYTLLDRPMNIPISELRRLKNLQELYLDGSIDKSFFGKVGVMTSLNVLTISRCRLNVSLPIFQGQFPTWLLENNTRLAVLNLENNSLTGTLQLPNHYIPNLLVLDISFNNIQGPIPNNFGLVFPNLEVLNISKNHFEGVIPSSYGNLISLEFLDMSNNNFSGTITENLTMGCSSLFYLKLSKNHLSGQLFLASWNLTQLVSLYLDNNHFSGEIPHSISNSSLRLIDFSNNNLSGMLPRWMENITMLEEIVLTKNQFEGPIPDELCNLELLLFLDLSHNNLNGSIPSCFNGYFIKHVHLNKNRLTGPITSAFKGCSNLVTLNLKDNYLTGNIPNWIGNLSSLSILLLKANYL